MGRLYNRDAIYYLSDAFTMRWCFNENAKFDVEQLLIANQFSVALNLLFFPVYVFITRSNFLLKSRDACWCYIRFNGGSCDDHVFIV